MIFSIKLYNVQQICISIWFDKWRSLYKQLNRKQNSFNKSIVMNVIPSYGYLIVWYNVLLSCKFQTSLLYLSLNAVYHLLFKSSSLYTTSLQVYNWPFWKLKVHFKYILFYAGKIQISCLSTSRISSILFIIIPFFISLEMCKL